MVFSNVLAALGRISHNPDMLPPGFIQESSGQDLPEAPPIAGGDIRRGDDLMAQDLVLAMTYVDAQGDASRRMITVKRVYQQGAIVYVDAFCHLRRMARKFRLDRVVELVDVRTGELIETHIVHLSHLCAASGIVFEKVPRGTNHKAVMSSVADGCRLLLHIGHADGELHELETEVILQYVDERAHDALKSVKPDYDVDAVHDWVRAQRPSWEQVKRAAERVLINPTHRRLMQRSIRNLIDSDGVLHEQEAWAAQEVLELLEQANRAQ